MSEKTVVITGAARTPMGGLQGELSALTAVELGAIAIKASVEKASIATDQIDEVIMGNVLSAGLKQGPARQAALQAGIKESAGCVTINKLCGSGLQALIYAHDMIKAGSASTVIAGGMESMSNAPHVLPQARQGLRTGHRDIYDHMFLDGLEDFNTGRMMGSFAQEIADAEGLTREAMDAFAIESLQRAQRAIDKGLLANEIVPVVIKNRKSEITIEHDEQPLTAKPEKIPHLRPAFAKDGSITAANASSISDGASALVVMEQTHAQALNTPVLATVVAHARFSQAPLQFTQSPIYAIDALLKKTGWTAADVDLFEINEAFAMVTMMAMSHFNLAHDKVNIFGGACAQGHPIGSTGSRLLVTLINALQQQGGGKGIACLCIGGGEALAVAIDVP